MRIKDNRIKNQNVPFERFAEGEVFSYNGLIFMKIKKLRDELGDYNAVIIKNGEPVRFSPLTEVEAIDTVVIVNQL